MNRKRILLIATVAALALGIVLSLVYNSIFLFIFIPFGLGWGIKGKSRKEDRNHEEPGPSDVKEAEI